MISKGEVLGIDIDIRKHNRQFIEKHKLFKRITMIEGSSTDKKIVKKVHQFAKDKKNVLLLLDSLHTQKHVLQELNFYSDLIKKNKEEEKREKIQKIYTVLGITGLIIIFGIFIYL